MPITNPIKETTLFKNVAPFIKSLNEDQLSYELVKASNFTEVAFRKNDLDSAMTWARTPQGGDFWLKLHNEYNINLNKVKPL